MYIALIILVSLLGLFLGYLFLICPEKPSPEARAVFGGRAYAHRGFYDNRSEAPENSLPAFERAMESGYGCELDVQFTRDKKLIVFHDNDYQRACGDPRPVWEVDWREARELKLFNSRERVPLFAEVLAAVDGREPLIIELKAEGLDTVWYYELCEAVMAELDKYKGPCCVESFHPLVVRWFRKNRPDIVRGQLASSFKSRDDLPFIKGAARGALICNVLSRPHFAAFKESETGAPFKLLRRLGGLGVVWTVKSEARHRELLDKTDAIIFEGYAPESRF
ncbi:MAG: glycerophosphodiester phosphodiesterase family protein [Oscillospiraceae bacterium]|nr:glycerophosphodiester phosphodiesterase family protein [Oscillospiraceae bacterium]